jgi:hypothetical protein
MIFYKLLQNFRFFSFFHLSFFHHFQCTFIIFFDASMFYFQKTLFKVFNNYLMANLTQGYNSFFGEQPWFLGFVYLTWIPPRQNNHNFKIVNLIMNVILVIDPPRRNIKTNYTLIMQSNVHNTSKQKHSILTSHKHKYMHTHPTTHIYKCTCCVVLGQCPTLSKLMKLNK